MLPPLLDISEKYIEFLYDDILLFQIKFLLAGMYTREPGQTIT